MALFQEKILKKFLVSDEIVTEKFQNYLKYKAKAEEIKNFKEEEFQDGFLRDIFESCLGFTLKSTNPKDFNLEREKKNEKDSKKADGAILLDGKVIGIIELKSYKTKNLDEVARQAFWYLNQNSNAHFVAISNFDELRFYINKATNYEKFKLFSLDFEEFKKLYTILSFSSISQNLPLKMQNESQEFEQNITKEFYKIFSKFRNELFENLLKNNENSDKIELLNASSKLCDRFIFMLFAKDRNLLPRNIFQQILEHFENHNLTDLKLYEIFKIYFEAINSGNEKLGIQAYNGGLFAADEVLNELKIDDEILKNNLEKLNSYDFESDISVNILGHIFEQSLSDLEEIESKLNAENFDKTTSKRKKDGVFYTPNFITTFIVENSLGKLCEDKKEELNLNEILENLKENKEKLAKIEGKKSKIAADERKILELKQEENLQILEKYKTWLLSLKIIDPACGSGAFLNEALEFLIKEHENLKAEMANAGNLFYGENIDISILENNLFGVDINSQAVEIAKLSLWLRTAKKGRKLTNLNKNLKCGNSLIDDKNLVENAFVWKEEFLEVFANGGFDIVIGNPPYVRGRVLEEKERKYLSKYGISSNDTAILFIKKAKEIMNKNALLSYIVPKSLLFASNWDLIRQEIYQNLTFLVDCGIVWKEVLLEQVIFLYSQEKQNFYQTGKLLDSQIIKGEKIKNYFVEIFNYLPVQESNESLKIAEKIKKNSKSLNFFYDNLAGVPNQKYISDLGEVKIIGGAEFNRYEIHSIKGLIEEKWLNTNNAKIKRNSLIVQNIIAHIKNPYEHIKITACIPLEEHIEKTAITNTVNQLILKDNFDISNKYTWCILNSKLINWFVYHFIFALAIRTMHFYNPISEKVPFILSEKQKPFIEKADLMLTLTAEIQNLKQNLLKELELEKIPKKLENFETLTFEEFIKELAKAKKIKFADKLAERNFKQKWQALFENDKNELLALQKESLKVDGEINSLVYKLYNLTDEEITIVENS